MDWLNHVVEAMQNGGSIPLSWSAYSAEYATNVNIIKSISSMLPLFNEDSHYVTLMIHAFKLIKKVTDFLNPGQTPVMIFDQPLYAIAKNIQWSMPERYGEDKLVVMLGGLHVEMGFLVMIGSWLNGSGWVESLEESGVSTFGKAESFLKDSHVKRSRYAHQVTACSLYHLLTEAYTESLASDFEEFSSEKGHVPQFNFWFITLSLELLLFTFVRSLREENFQLYTEILCKMAPWFFALDRINYSRWLPVNIRDMQSLSITHPDVFQNFMEGKFAIHNSERKFSGISSIDQAHEQNNKRLKGQNGIIGLTTNESALNCWIVTGPQIAEMLKQFKASIGNVANEHEENEATHHEEGETFQKQFRSDVEKLTMTIKEYGSPFSEDSKDSLIVLHTGSLKKGVPVDNVMKIAEVGQKAYEAFITERFVERKEPIYKTISMNNLRIFDNETAHGKKEQQIKCLKNDVSLFSRLFIACQNRVGDLDDFFRYENQEFPPSISQYNDLRSGNKADLLKYLENKAASPSQSDPPEFELTIIDGAAIINALTPDANKTFKEYAAQKFIPRIAKLLSNVLRIDVVFDVYLENSLKNSARLHRGEGSRKRVKDNYKVPTNWKAFLRFLQNLDTKI